MKVGSGGYRFLFVWPFCVLLTSCSVISHSSARPPAAGLRSAKASSGPSPDSPSPPSSA